MTNMPSIGYLGQFQSALSEIEKVMEEGEKTHKKDEWKSKSTGHHIDHTIDHLDDIELMFDEIDSDLFCEKDIDQERLFENLSHAATRCLMALELYLRNKNEPKH